MIAEMTAGRRLKPKLLVQGLGIVFVALMIIVAGLTIFIQRQQAIETWRNTLVTTARLLAGHANQTIAAADLVQKSIADRVVELGIASDAALRQKLGTQSIFEMLRDEASGVPQLDVAAIVTHNGDVVNFSRSFPPPVINLADRDYFQAHFADRNLGLYLSIPVHNRANGHWTFYLSRKLRNAQGDAIGLTLTGIQSQFFTDYYASVNFSKFSAISLYRTDGALLARVPEKAEAMGKIFGEQPALRALRAGQDSIVTQEPRLVDGRDSRFRIVAVQAVPSYPLAVVVTATEELILADWHRKAWLIGGGTLLMSAVFLALILWIGRLLDEHDRAVLRLKRSEEELACKAATLVEKNQELEQFAYVASHDLRQPLRMVSSYLGLIERQLHDRLGDEEKSFLGFAINGAKRMDRMILDLLDYSRIGREEPEPQEVFLEDCLEECLKNLEVAIAESGARVHLDGTLPKVHGHGGHLTRLFQNLIGNAVKYRVETRLADIGISCRSEGSVWRIEVTDNGSGIPQEMRERAFAIFQRLVSRDVVEGNGIGLSICRKIVEFHGGHIWIETPESGVGSRFVFTLPKD